jgi:hypothetical protein
MSQVQVEVKVKILRVHPAERGVDVLFYTDSYPQGLERHVTIYPVPMPTGAALKAYLLSYANTEWFAHVQRQSARTRPDCESEMAELATLVGVEISTVKMVDFTPKIEEPALDAGGVTTL